MTVGIQKKENIMKHIITGIALIATGTLLAVPPQGQGPGSDGPPPPPEPGEMATHLVEAFDVDGNGALDVEELTDALIFLHENRPQRPPHERGPRDE
jgi:hypothetical protein